MKKNEKFLALLLSVVMILTCFVGTVTVNAENATPTATIVVTADAVEVGATKIPVTLTVESEVGINEALIKVSSDLGDIIAQPTVVVNEGVGTAIADNAGNATDYNAFYLSAVSPDGQAETVMGEITKATIKVVFTNEAGIAAKETPYTVNVEIPEGKVIAASKDEVAIDLVCDGLEIVVEEAHEHAYTYTDNGDGTHNGACACGEDAITNEVHNFVDGVCDKCSAAEVVKPTYNADLKVKAKNALFQSDYSLMFAVPTSTAEGWYLVVEQDKYDGTTKIDPRVETLTVEDTYNVQNVNGVQCNTLLLTGIGARDVASEIRITLYAEVDGVMSYGPTESYNLVSYARKQIDNGLATTATTKKKNFAKAMVAFLNYATAAQNRFKYNNTAANLANAVLTEEEKALAPLASEPVNYRNDASVVIENPTSSILAYAPQYKDKITLSVLVDAPTADLANLYLQIDYVDSKGVQKNDSIALIDGADTSYNGAIKKQINFTSVSFADVRTNINLKVVDANGNAISNTGIYSFESYAASRKTTSADYEASRALVNFGDYIKIYFNN